jgi:hypothetical protein
MSLYVLSRYTFCPYTSCRYMFCLFITILSFYDLSLYTFCHDTFCPLNVWSLYILSLNPPDTCHVLTESCVLNTLSSGMVWQTPGHALKGVCPGLASQLKHGRHLHLYLLPTNRQRWWNRHIYSTVLVSGMGKFKTYRIIILQYT